MSCDNRTISCCWEFCKSANKSACSCLAELEKVLNQLKIKVLMKVGKFVMQ